jgi:hypothetical protein
VSETSPMDPYGQDRSPWRDYTELGEADVASRLTERMATAVEALQAVYGLALSVGRYEYRRDRRPDVMQAATHVCVELERMLDITPPPTSKRWG